MRLEDEIVSAALGQGGGLDQRGRAHLQLLRQPGAGAWLLAMPSHATGNAIAAPLFLTMLRRRLRMPVFERAFNCPLCAGVMDTFGDHALVCACGGDRTVRHNKLRDLVLRWAHAAGHAAVAEKAGLLPPRPFIGAAWENGTAGADARCRPAARRPADVYLPAWSGGRPAAIDLAVTSGLQAGLLDLSAVDGGAAAARYADRKRHHLDTAAQCDDAGLKFVPFIFEAEGGLGSEARALLTLLSRDAARLTSEEPAVRDGHAVQALSVSLQRSNALAIARRAVGSAPPLCAPLAAARDHLHLAAAAQPSAPDAPAGAAGNPAAVAAAAAPAPTPAATAASSTPPCASACGTSPPPPAVPVAAAAAAAAAAVLCSPPCASVCGPPPAAPVPLPPPPLAMVAPRAAPPGSPPASPPLPRC
eukprot:gene8066-biopygen42227